MSITQKPLFIATLAKPHNFNSKSYGKSESWVAIGGRFSPGQPGTGFILKTPHPAEMTQEQLSAVRDEVKAAMAAGWTAGLPILDLELKIDSFAEARSLANEVGQAARRAFLEIPQTNVLKCELFVKISVSWEMVIVEMNGWIHEQRGKLDAEGSIENDDPTYVALQTERSAIEQAQVDGMETLSSDDFSALDDKLTEVKRKLDQYPPVVMSQTVTLPQHSVPDFLQRLASKYPTAKVGEAIPLEYRAVA